MNLTNAMVAGLPQPANMNGKKIWSVPILPEEQRFAQ